MSAVSRPARLGVLAVVALGCALACAFGCATGTGRAAGGADTTGAVAARGDSVTAGGVSRDSSGETLVPTGYGTLRQDDLSLHVDGPGVLVRVLPLDESVIRLLTPDSYRAMRDLRNGSRKAVEAIVKRNGGRAMSVWLVSFYGLVPDARFTPQDVLIGSGGQDFRAYDVVPLTVGFGEQRLRQRETQNALFVYDGDIELDQPITVSYGGARDDSWEETLQRIERERAMVRARAAR